MIIKSIHLTNFRNHHDYYLDCNDDTTLILGKNGSGKTSVLEAIYICTRGKSFRATDQDIIKRGTDFYRIELSTDSGEQIVAVFDGNNKTYHILDKKTRRLPKTKKYPIILFEPRDLNLITGSPSRHRDYFNRFFSEINDEYHVCISKYDKALRQRNEALKSENIDSSSLFSWDVMLSKYGTKIYEIRKKLIDEINNQINDTYKSIAKNNDKVSINYKTELNNTNESKYLNKMSENHEKDIYLGHTSFGIHKDDFEFIFNNQPAEGSASRGESRSIILALKFIEANMTIDMLGHKPIILLDDVFSELDEERRKCLIENFKDNQVIITSVENITNIN